MLTVFIDFKSPASYLALQPTLKLARDSGIKIDWRAFVSTERPAPTRVENESVGASHQRVRAMSRRRLQAHYANVQGIEMRWPSAERSADCALGALAAANSNPECFIEKAFHAYWVDGADLNDSNVVQTFVDSARLETAEPSLWRQALSDAHAAAEELGIVDAPAYLVKEQIFIGREHLPWIKELVEQKS